ncbi:MAG: TonB-dependent receptor plug domain-containing protein [Hyphomicrobiales bacterium]
MGPHRLRRRRRTRIAPTAAVATCLVVASAVAPAASFARASAARGAESAPADSVPRYRLDPTVVTAERLPVPLSRVPSDVTVIGRDRLDHAQPFLLADALRDVPGLDVQRSGSLGKLTDVRLRGADPRHTLVLFDGIPLNGPWLGTFDFADLPGTGWGGVEVMGGPASSLYGSGAVGGVIQMLSPAGTATDRLRAFTEAGADATFRQGASWRGSAGAARIGAAASHLTSDGITARDGYAGTAAQARLDVPRGTTRLAVSAIATRGRKEIPYDYRFDTTDFTTHEVADPNSEETDRLAAARATLSRPAGSKATLEAEVSGLSGRIRFRNAPDAGTTDFVDTRLDQTRGIVSLRARLRDLGPVQAVLGAEYRDEHVHRADDSQYGGFPSVSDLRRGVHARALYAQAHVDPAGRLFADFGIRLEDHARYGAIGVPRAAVGLAVPEAGLKLRAGYGRAFTAPTLTDLYYPGYSNEALRPERSRTWEAGADGRWLGGRVEAHLTWHTTHFRDLIESNAYYVPGNVGRARIEGEEASVRVVAGRALALRGYAANLIGTNLETGARLAKRPRHRAGIAADVTTARGLRATASLRWTDPSYDPFAFTDPAGRFLSGDLPGYAALDLGIAASLARWIPAEARLRVDNVLDRRYAEVRGYPARGRAATVGLTFAP